MDFDESFLKKLEYLYVVAKKVFVGRIRAERRSRKTGSGVEFADHRNYAAGDDLRYLDWSVYGRLDKLLLRLFEEEEDLHIYLLLDASASMRSNGKLDYADEFLAQMEVVVCSIHSFFNLERAEMTARMLAAIENPYTQIIAHPTGRMILRRDELDYDMEKIMDACAKHGVAMECNSYPERLDLREVYLRMCKERGVKVVISTDSHNTMHLPYIKYGVTTARRGWLEQSNVINTLPVDKFLAALRPKPGSVVKKAAAKSPR